MQEELKGSGSECERLCGMGVFWFRLKGPASLHAACFPICVRDDKLDRTVCDCADKSALWPSEDTQTL